MVVHPAAGHADGTLVNALLHHVDDLERCRRRARPGIVHRLDRGTSGVMVVAKNDRAHARARAAVPRPRGHEGVRGARLGRRGGRAAHRGAHRARPGEPAEDVDPRAPVAGGGDARPARASTLPGVTLAQLGIATGRTHQIRVHLASIGHPVVGDALYGGVHRRVPPHLKAVSRLDRPFLHAARLAFTHPVDGQRAGVRRALPPDLQSVLDDIEATARSSACDSRRAATACRPPAPDRPDDHGSRHHAHQRTQATLLEDRTVFEGRVFTVSSDVVRLPNGRDVQMDVIRHAPSVVLVPMPDPEHVILIRQYRYAGRTRGSGRCRPGRSIRAKTPTRPRAASATRKSGCVPTIVTPTRRVPADARHLRRGDELLQGGGPPRAGGRRPRPTSTR